MAYLGNVIQEIMFFEPVNVDQMKTKQNKQNMLFVPGLKNKCHCCCLNKSE